MVTPPGTHTQTHKNAGKTHPAARGGHPPCRRTHISQKSVQHLRFPSGHPPQYSEGLTGLNFGKRNGNRCFPSSMTVHIRLRGHGGVVPCRVGASHTHIHIEVRERDRDRDRERQRDDHSSTWKRAERGGRGKGRGVARFAS